MRTVLGTLFLAHTENSPVRGSKADRASGFGLRLVKQGHL